MLGIRQFLKKENRMCPICDIPYIRGKRDLMASYFDAFYGITTWTLYCPECGYEVILPGTARIHAVESSLQGMYASMDNAPKAVFSVISPAAQQAGGTWVSDSGTKAPTDHDTSEGHINEPMVEATEPVKKSVEIGIEESIPVQEGYKGDADPADNDGPSGGEDTKRGIKESMGEDARKDVPALGMGTGSPREETGLIPSADRFVLDKADTTNVADIAASPKATVTAEKGKTADAGKAISHTDENAGGSVPKCRDKKAGVHGNFDIKPAPRQESPGQERKKQPQKEAAVSNKRKQVPQEVPGDAKPSASDVQPMPKYGQAGAFQGKGSSGLPSSIFPSSAFSNLEALRVSVQAGIDKKEDGRIEVSAPGKGKTAPKSAIGRGGTSQEQVNVAGKALFLEFQERRPEKKLDKGEGNLQLDVRDTKQESSADSKNQDETLQEKKILSAKSRTEASKPATPTDALEKTEEKCLSAENGKSGTDKADADTSFEKKLDTVKAVEVTEAHEASEGEKHKEYPDSGERQKDPLEQAKAAAKKIQERIPADLADKLPMLSQISKQQKHSLFLSEERRFLDEHVPHKQVIINDLIYDTDNSEMFLRVKGQYGLDNPCVHYNYRTQNGNFFRCTVRYRHEDSIRALDVIEAKRMLEEYPGLYRKFFPDSVADA